MPRSEHPAAPADLNPSSESRYAIAARFRTGRTSSRVYERARNTLYRTEGCDLSAYRLLLDSIWHVAVLGQQPASELDRRLRLILSSGEPVSLPDDILEVLFLRRAAATENGPWVERRHHPGVQL